MAKVTQVHADGTGLWHATVLADTRTEALSAGRARILYVLIRRERKTTETPREARIRLNNYLRVSAKRVDAHTWLIREV